MGASTGALKQPRAGMGQNSTLNWGEVLTCKPGMGDWKGRQQGGRTSAGSKVHGSWNPNSSGDAPKKTCSLERRTQG